MFANSRDLLSEINTIIRNNSSHECDPEFDLSLISSVFRKVKEPLAEKDLLMISKTQLKGIDDRIQLLEEQNSQLIRIVYFLFEKISALADSETCEEKIEIKMYECEMELKPDQPVNECNCKPGLTKREMDVFHLLEQGLCAKEIAKILFISESTVITHKRNLKEKFHAKNTVELISKVLGTSH